MLPATLGDDLATSALSATIIVSVVRHPPVLIERGAQQLAMTEQSGLLAGLDPLPSCHPHLSSRKAFGCVRKPCWEESAILTMSPCSTSPHSFTRAPSGTRTEASAL